MSGGHFEYDQYRITNIVDSIQSELDRQGKEREDDWHTEDWYKQYPEDRFYPTYSERTNKAFKKAIGILKEAFVYAHRIDRFLSGDDGEETFHERLEEDLNELQRFDKSN